MTDDKTPPPDQDNSHELVSVVLDHYLQHHELVLKKLQLAQKATRASIEKVESIDDKEDTEKLDAVWTEIIALFASHGASEDELFKIEEILGTTPKTINELYESLVKKDEDIQNILSKMDRTKYENAMQQIVEVQSGPNPMSGLNPEDYELDDSEKKTLDKAFKMMPSAKKKK